MITPKTLQEALQDPTTEYCDVHDTYYNPVLDEWLESTCSDSTCVYCVGRPAKPSEVVRNVRKPL